MSATERLRKLLDERGVEYTQRITTEGVLFTVATSVISEERYFILVLDYDAGIGMWSQYITPEQAIAATLGPRTCHQVVDKSKDWYTTVCSECGFTLAVEEYGPSNFCPNCGRKVLN